MVKRKYHLKQKEVKPIPEEIETQDGVVLFPQDYEKGQADGRLQMLDELKSKGRQVRKDPMRGIIVIKDGNDNLLFRSKANSGTVVFIPD